MSDITGYEDVYTPGQDSPDPSQPNDQRDDRLVRMKRSDIRALEQSAAKGREAEDRATAAERRLAFLEAGIDLTTERGKFFADGYNGDLDPAKIRAKAETVGALEVSTPEATPPPADAQPTETETPDTQLEEGEANLSRERQALAENAPPDQPTPGDPYAEAARVHKAAMEDGAPEKVAVGSALARVVQSAIAGDQRVILDKSGGART